MPLGAIQRSLGHLTANSTAAFLEIPEADPSQTDVALLDSEKSAAEDNHNVFAGKVAAITPGDLQSLLEVETLGGHRLVSVLSNDHLKAMGLRKGSPVTARIRPPRLSRDAEKAAPGPNRFRGVVERILADPRLDPQGRGYQIVQSLLAIGSGGLTGTHWGHGAA